ncbi:MAG: hypothetical protein HY898_20780 [Deltaproteobacteria bacterium]|nr:hypothetical protein [Deltaproteobacteria bacterium]
MNRPLALLTLATVSLTFGCGPEPQPGRRHAPANASPPAASASSRPTAFTGKLEPHEDPIDALKARTYVLATNADVVHAGTTAGVVSWSFKDRAHPTQLATVVLPGSVSGLTLFGPSRAILAVSTGPTGLVLVDTSNASRGRLDRLSDAPWKPEARGGCHAVWNATTADDRLAFLACGTGGVAEADLADHARPKVVRTLDVDGYVRDVAILNEAAGIPKDKASPRRIAAAAGNAGLITVEFPAAGAPRILARLATTGEARALEVHDGIAYVADGAAGLRIVDVRDPGKPLEIGRFDPKTVDLTRGVTVQGRTAFLCLGDSGLMSVDTSDPKAPRKLAAIDPRRALNRATAEGSLLYAANDASGILLLDIAKPEAPQQLFPPPDPKAAGK